MAESFLNNLLSQFGAGSKEIVFVSVTPGIGLEMIQVDVSAKMVKAYGSRPLEYNESMREITSYDDLKTALSELFTELHVNPKSSIYFSLPSVHVGKIELPLLLNDDGITTAITSTVEQSYIFKKCEPIVSWFEILAQAKSENRTIMYSAIQKIAVEKIKQVVTELGGSLKLIENSIISILRALAYTELTQVQMQDGTPWNLMLINPTGYSIVSLIGQDIVDYYEEPIAFKTYELEEVYSVINSSAQLSLMNYPANYLFIVSQTDMVSAEHLASIMQFDGKINFYEDNSYKKEEILSISLDIVPSNVKTISLEAIGLGVCTNYSYPVLIDYSGNNKVDSPEGDKTISFLFQGKEVVLTERALMNISFVLCAVLIIPVLAAMLLLPPLEKQKKAKVDEVNKQIAEIDKNIKGMTEQTTTAASAFDANKEIEIVLKANRVKLIAYSAIGESVPRNLWVTYFNVSPEGKIQIKGTCDDVEGIYKFFKNMKDYLVDSQLRLHKLEMINPSLDSAVTAMSGYQFEITNMSEAELNPILEPEVVDDKSAKKAKGKKVNDLQQVKGK